MRFFSREQSLIRRYLLGELDEKRCESFEQKILTDRRFRKRVLLVEDELFDDYVLGALSGDERRKFGERLLATPEQVRKLEAAEAFNEFASHEPAEPLPLPRTTGRLESSAARLNALLRSKRGLIYVAAALALVACAGLAVRVFVLRTSESAVEEELARLNAGEAEGQPSASPLTPAVNVALNPILLRQEGKQPVVRIIEGAELVRFELGLMGGESQSLEATLRTLEGRELFTVRRLTAAAGAGGRVAVLKVPARLLPDGDYLLELRGESPDGQPPRTMEYYFRVARAAPEDD